MKRVAKYLGIPVIAGFLLQGCLMSTKTYTPKPFENVEVKTDKGLIYIYRPNSILSKHIKWRFIINKEVVGPLLNNGYITTYVKPGETNIVMQQYDYPNNKYDELKINVEKNRSYYIKAVPAPFDFSTLQFVSKEVGSQEVKNTTYYIEDK